MKKVDFVQQAAIEFLPQVGWDMDKAIKYAEKLWLILDQRGYGNAKVSKPKDMVNYYQKLPEAQRKQFELFWIAFDNKAGKQRAAMRWGQLGLQDHAQIKKIIAAAKQTAEARKHLKHDQVPVMAERWLNELRFDDYEQTHTEKSNKKQNQAAAKLRELTATLNHAKQMTEKSPDEFWPKEVSRLTEKLKKMRDL